MLRIPRPWGLTVHICALLKTSEDLWAERRPQKGLWEWWQGRCSSLAILCPSAASTWLCRRPGGAPVEVLPVDRNWGPLCPACQALVLLSQLLLSSQASQTQLRLKGLLFCPPDPKQARPSLLGTSELKIA